jgi:tRNA(Ile)-lysidine synthase
VPAAEAAGPLADAELEGLLAPFAGAGTIALAVSGGADSLAMLDCVDRWRRHRALPPGAVVLTVDHRLRPGSGREAAAVAALARSRGLTARVLRWNGPRPVSDIEAAARAARYRLLIEAARAAGATALLVAHHRDDQAETLLMRLSRGAGVFGLAAMRPALDVGALTIARPFLDVPRARLAATTAAAGLTPVVDPMNADRRFLRARIRGLMPLLADAGMDAARLAALAGRMRNAAEAIDRAASAFLAAAVRTDAFAVAWLDASRFSAEPSDVRLRALVRLLIAVGGGDYPPRFARLRRLDEGLRGSDDRRRFKRTLAGVVVERRGGRFAFYRECGRAGLRSLAVKPGFAGLWDRRFSVDVGGGRTAGLTLGPLGEAGRRGLGAVAAGVPAGALAALPALRRGGRVVAAPGVGGVEGAGWPMAARPLVAERLAEPPLFPDVAGE